MSTYHFNINAAYNAVAASHDGTESEAFCLSELDTLVGAGTVNGVTLAGGDTILLIGEAVDSEVFRLIQMSLTIRSWPGRLPWKLNDTNSGPSDYFQLVNVGDTLDVYDGIIGGIRAYGGAAGNRITFHNCLTWGVYTYAQSNGSQRIYQFKECTISGEIVLYGAAIAASGECEFIDCVFIDTDISDQLLWTSIEFSGKNIFNRSQADVNDLDGTTTETGWDSGTFSYALSATLPAYNVLEIEDIVYADYGLPLVFTQPSRWNDSYLSEGWYDKFRYGYGAFYFAFDTSMSASPKWGTGPLTVQFTANATSSLVNEDDGYLWDFGDGETTKEKNPEHVYIPGEYNACLTVTTLWGTEITECVTIYVYENDYSPGGRNVTKTSKIYRLGVPQEQKQGKGWSEYEGGDYPNAIGLVGTCKLFTAEDEDRVIVTDCNTFKHYWLGKEDHWVDGENAAYGGSEFTSDILFRELLPEIQATAKIKHSESEANIKPWLKERRNVGEYDTYGFRMGFTASIYFREDSMPVDRAVVKYFPRKAQIVSDRQLESESLQAGLRITKAPWRLVSIQQWYQQIDTAAAPDEKQMSEKTWAESLADSVIWIGRSVEIVSVADGTHLMPWDKGSNQRTTGSFIGVTEGPDNKSRSAIIFGASDDLTVDQDIAAGDLSILLWLRSPAASCSLIDNAILNVRIVQDGEGWELNWDDGVNDVSIFIGELNQWVMLSLIRREGSLEVYKNGIFVNSQPISESPAYAGPITFYNGQVIGFEPRVVGNALTEDAIKWLYDDVTENNGNSTCAMY